jgi:hypothetical protein
MKEKHLASFNQEYWAMPKLLSSTVATPPFSSRAKGVTLQDVTNVRLNRKQID